MKLVCLNCGHRFHGSISHDELGWHSVCPDCRSSFDVDLPAAKILMAFAEDSDKASGYYTFKENIEESIVRTVYAFDTVEDFYKEWKRMVQCPDGMWYWVIADGKCICSGACDPCDDEIFEEYFGKPVYEEG